jgi:hypothetical protein
MANITYDDKDKNVKDGVHNKMRDIDANEIKRVVNGKVDADKIGVPNGIVPLGPDNKIPEQYLQESEEADEIPIVPSGDLEATNVADAIAELEAEKQPRLGFNPENVGNKATNLTETTSNTKYPSVKATVDGDNATLEAAKVYADSINTNVLRYRGYHDPTGPNVYPTTGGSGTAGAIMPGDTWEINPAGGGYDLGDLIVAKIATPGQTAANWGKTAHNTTQATELARGTAMLATQAEMEDETTSNDIDIITPKKFWFGIAKAVTLPFTWAAKQIFTSAPRFSSVLLNQYLKVDVNKDLVGVDQIPGGDVTAATDAAKGVVELATSTETRTGTDVVRAVTPAGLAARINKLPVFEFSADYITTAPVVLSGVGQVVQGDPLVAGKVVIVNAQAIATENGLYITDAGAWLRIGVTYNNDVYNYAGDFEGTRIFCRKDKKTYQQVSTAAEIGTAGQNWTESGSGGSGGGDLFAADITVSLLSGETFGKYKNGDVIPANGKTPVQVIIDANTRYLDPAFTAFAITGQANSIESGESIASGAKTFTWATSNSSNVATNSLAIRNQTANTDLTTGQANDGTEAGVNVPSAIQLNGDNVSQVFRIVGTKANGGVGTFSRDLTITSFYAIFYGPVSAAPADSAAVRAMTKRLRNAGNVWQLNTGTVEKIFAIWLPTGRTLVSVKDLDALNLDITASYVSSAMSVNDAGGTSRAGTLYVMTATVPYSTNHRHEITIS